MLDTEPGKSPRKALNLKRKISGPENLWKMKNVRLEAAGKSMFPFWGVHSMF